VEIAPEATYSVQTRDGTVTFKGRLIGIGTSQRSNHVGAHRLTFPDKPGERFTEKGSRCSACRWFETRIYEVTQDSFESVMDIRDSAKYAVHTMGKSVVPNEITLCRLEWANSGHEVIEWLTVRREDEVFLPAPAARALAQAAGYDREIEAAYVNRAVL
jgi:hypothetical protein